MKWSTLRCLYVGSLFASASCADLVGINQGHPAAAGGAAGEGGTSSHAAGQGAALQTGGGAGSSGGLEVGGSSGASGAGGSSERITDFEEPTASGVWENEEAYSPAKAIDNDSSTGWCAARLATSVADFGNAETFDDSWRVRFKTPQILGAIHMRSGWIRGDDWRNNDAKGTLTHKLSDFVWAYRSSGTSWARIPEASMYANRYQLIFRFAPLKNVEEIAVFSRRDPDELVYLPDAGVNGANGPCLREVAFYARQDAEIPTEPWFYSVATWDGASEADGWIGNRYTTHRHFSNRPAIRELVANLVGTQEIDSRGDYVDLKREYSDLEDHIWFGEFHEKNVKWHSLQAGPESVVAPTCPNRSSHMLRTVSPERVSTDLWDCELPESSAFPNWILWEPAPAGFLLSENYRDFANRSPRLASGFYKFLKKHAPSVPILAAGGGHQLLAMSQILPTYAEFEREFTPDAPNHVSRPCNKLIPDFTGTDPEACAERPSNAPHWVDRAKDQLTAIDDMLFDSIPKVGPFQVWHSHHRAIVPEQLSKGNLQLVATYEGTQLTSPPSLEQASTTQAIKLLGRPVYGTEFHWHETTANGECSPERQNMEMVQKNFLLIAMNRLHDHGTVLSGNKPEDLDKLKDADKETSWCTGDAGEMTITFKSQEHIRYVQLAKGPSTSVEFSWSNDGANFFPVTASEQTTASLVGKYSKSACGSAGSPDQTTIATFDHSVATRFLKLRVKGKPACLRELNVLKLTFSLTPPH